MKRVVITGIGSVTPLGMNFHKAWESLKRGISGLSHCRRIKTDDIPWKIAGEIRGLDMRAFLTPKEEKRLDLFIQYALVSAIHAVEDSSLQVGKETMVIIGSSRGGITRLEESLKKYILDNRPISAYLMPGTTISMAPSYIAQRFGLKGYSLGISNACASGTIAIGEAYRLIRDGYGKVAITGGTEAPLCRLCLEGYGNAGALSKRNDFSASRPFDKNRDGFVLSEGACMVVIEEMEHAIKRGAKVYAEIIGYSQLTVGEHQTRPVVTGEIEVVRNALKVSGVSPVDIEMINAHGASTVSGDRVEADALFEVFGEQLKDISVTANKSMTGHMLAASGALEVASTVMSLHEGIIPPTINLRDPEPGCNLKVVTSTEEKGINIALSSSFGFGGVNAAVVLKKVY